MTNSLRWLLDPDLQKNVMGVHELFAQPRDNDFYSDCATRILISSAHSDLVWQVLQKNEIGLQCIPAVYGHRTLITYRRTATANHIEPEATGTALAQALAITIC